MCQYLLVLLVTSSTSIICSTDGRHLPLEDQSTDDPVASVSTKSHSIYHQNKNTESKGIVRKQVYGEIDGVNPTLKSTDLIPLELSNEFIKTEGNKMVYKFEDEASNVFGKSALKSFLEGAAGQDSWIWKLIPTFNSAYLKDYWYPDACASIRIRRKLRVTVKGDQICASKCTKQTTKLLNYVYGKVQQAALELSDQDIRIMVSEKPANHRCVFVREKGEFQCKCKETEQVIEVSPALLKWINSLNIADEDDSRSSLTFERIKSWGSILLNAVSPNSRMQVKSQQPDAQTIKPGTKVKQSNEVSTFKQFVVKYAKRGWMISKFAPFLLPLYGWYVLFKLIQMYSHQNKLN